MCSWDELFEEAKGHMFDLSLTPEVLQSVKLKSEDLGAMANIPKTWVELAMMRAVGEGPSS